MKEIELKFLIDPPAEQALRARLAGMTTGVGGGGRSATLVSIYHDTDGQALRQRGIALRLRRTGRRWVQTVKAGRVMRAGLSEAREAECPAPGGRLALDAIPDADLRAEIAALGAEALHPVFETRIRRLSHRLSLPSGEVELAIDCGEIHAGDRSAPLREVELELLEGDRGALFEAVRLLFPDGGLVFSERSKAERGWLLAETGSATAPATPRLAGKIVLDDGMATELAAREILSECLDQIAGNIAAMREGPDPEGPHQLRVGLRRLRSSLSLFRPALAGPETARLEGEAKWLAAEVGRLRDLDVIRAEMLAPVAEAHPRDRGLAALAEALEARAAAVRAHLDTLLAGPRVQALVIDLAAFIETRGWLRPDDFDQTALLARPVAEAGAEALEKRLAKAAKLGRKTAKLDIEDRHELRKRLKKLRYGVEFIGPCFKAKKVKPFLKRLKAMQEVLGHLADWAMAEALLAGPDSPAAHDPAAQRAAGRLLGRAEAGAARHWEDARALWSDLAGQTPFWR